MPDFRRSPKDKVESRTLKQEAVTLKLPWRLKDVKDARAMGYMLRKTANSEWNYPGESSLLQSTKMKKRNGDLKTALPSAMEMRNLEFAQLVSCLALEITVN